MHELSIASDILDIARRHVPAGEEDAVGTIVVRVGDMAGVVPASLAFSFEVAVKESPFPHAQLEIERVPLTGSCNRCGETSALDPAAIMCARCKSSDVAVMTGTELQVARIILREHAL